MRVFLLLMAWLSLRAIKPEMRAHKEFREVAAWPVTSAQVHSADSYWKRNSWGGSRFCAKLEYSYSVEGRLYRGTNSIFDFGCHPDGYDVAAAHPPGSTVQVAYNPTDAAVTVVPGTFTDPGYPWFDMIAGTACLLIALWNILRSTSEPDDLMLEEEVEPEDTRIFLGL